MRPALGSTTGAVALAAAVAISGCSSKDDDAKVREEIAAVRAENAKLREELDSQRAENGDLQRHTEEKMADAALAHAREMEQLRGEMRAVREEMAVVRGHAPPPVLVGAELEERLGRKVRSVQDAVWESPPSSCVEVLRTIVETYPNTRAALKAKGILADWGVADGELTGAGAAEIDEKVRAVLDAQARVWHELQDAMWLAEEGRAKEAVDALQKIAEGYPRGTGMHAREMLKEWGVAGLDPETIDFGKAGPRIQRQAAAWREVEAAFDSLRRGLPEAAAEAFKEIAKKYPDLRQATRAREGLERAGARIRERERQRAEEERRAKRRAREEAKAREAEAAGRRPESPAGARDGKPGRQEPEKEPGELVF